MIRPAWTCPQIDATKGLVRRIRWRLRTGRLKDEVPALLLELDAALEVVREENRALREWARSRG